MTLASGSKSSVDGCATGGRASLGRRLWWLATGVGAAGLAVAFAVGGLGGPAQSLTAAVFLVVLPATALAQARALPEVDLRRRRVEAYVGSIVALAAIGLLALWLGRDLPVQPRIWLSPPPAIGVLLAAGGVLTAGGLVLVYTFKRASPTFGWRETAAVRDIMPSAPREKALFALLSVVAGVFEEVAFRGFLPAFLMPWTGSYLLAALPAAAAFGLLHAYQGRHGMVRTGLLGLWLAAGVGWTGSLWPSIFAHAALDLLIGLALAPSLLGDLNANPAPTRKPTT